MKFKIKQLIAGCLIGLIIITIVLAFYSNSVKNFLQTNKLIPEPESFTELYFENSANLPSNIESDEPYYFTFTIHNLENKRMTYPFEVFIASGSSNIKLDKNTVTLANNEYKTIYEKFSLKNLESRSAIIVKLIDKDQYIDFWIQQYNPLPENTAIIGSSEVKQTSSQSSPIQLQDSPTQLQGNPLNLQVGAWYWQPQLNRAQLYWGKKLGQEVWLDSYPVPTPTPTEIPSSNNSSSSVTPTQTPQIINNPTPTIQTPSPTESAPPLTPNQIAKVTPEQ